MAREIPIEMLSGPAALAAELLKLDDGGVLAQELVQKGAMHAVRTAVEQIQAGAHPLPLLRRMLKDLEKNAEVITAECTRRNLVTVRA